MNCLDRWLTAYERGNFIADYLRHCQMNSIGIYGYGMLGRHLVYELQEKGVSIQWVLDRSASGDERYDRILKPESWKNLPDVDMAVITTLADVEEIEMLLADFVTGQIISVEELIENLYRWGRQG